MSASSAPAAKAALLALIQADATITGGGVQVSYAEPSANIGQESIWFDRTLLDEVAAALGRQRRNESYVLELVVFVARDGDDPQACEERAWALVAVIENLLRANADSPRLGGAVNLWAVFEGCEMQPGIAPHGGQRVAIGTCRIRCEHRK